MLECVYFMKKIKNKHKNISLKSICCQSNSKYCCCNNCCPQCQCVEPAYDIFASFFLFEKKFENGQLIPFTTGIKDTTGNITLVNETKIKLMPGYYFISYRLSTILDDAGYMQVTPSYNGKPYLQYGIYFKTNTASSSASGSNSIIIYVPSQTYFKLTYNSNVENRSGEATLTVIKLKKPV